MDSISTSLAMIKRLPTIGGSKHNSKSETDLPIGRRLLKAKKAQNPVIKTSTTNMIDKAILILHPYVIIIPVKRVQQY